MKNVSVTKLLRFTIFKIVSTFVTAWPFSHVHYRLSRIVKRLLSETQRALDRNIVYYCILIIFLQTGCHLLSGVIPTTAFHGYITAPALVITSKITIKYITTKNIQMQRPMRQNSEYDYCNDAHCDTRWRCNQMISKDRRSQRDTARNGRRLQTSDYQTSFLDTQTNFVLRVTPLLYLLSQPINPFNASCCKLLLFEGSSAILL